jgi:hypothetical protein
MQPKPKTKTGALPGYVVPHGHRGPSAKGVEGRQARTLRRVAGLARSFIILHNQKLLVCHFRHIFRSVMSRKLGSKLETTKQATPLVAGMPDKPSGLSAGAARQCGTVW